MYKEFIQTSGTVVVPYVINKIFKIADKDNPLFNANVYNKKITFYTIFDNCILSPIREELVCRLLPYLLLKIFMIIFMPNNQILYILFMYWSGPHFGLLHIPSSRTWIYKLYYFVYAMTGGLIFGNIYFENNIILSYAKCLLFHSYHNLLCDFMWYMEQ